MKHPDDASPLIVWILAIFTFGLTFMVLSIAHADPCKDEVVKNDANWTQAIKTAERQWKQDMAISREREEKLASEVQVLKYQNGIITEQLKELKEGKTGG